MKRTLLRWHLGLGDALLCNGLVRVLVERGHALLLPCWEHNVESVRAMFADIGDAVQVDSSSPTRYLNARHFEETGTRVITLGHEGQNFEPLRFDESFYAQAGVPFLAKWEKFSLPEIEFEPYGPYHTFLHDDAGRGFSIPGFDNASTYRPDPAKLLWRHLPYLMSAKEIHCISSSFAILADLINAPGTKYLHRYARPDGGALPIFGREWTIYNKKPL